MTKYVVGPKILKKEQVLISIFLITILVLSSGSMVAFAKSNTYLVKPNGHDDTADIQAAFNACGTSPGCTVRLVAGTYYTAQITVYGFQGSFLGMGQGVTVIQALPNLPSPATAYNTPTSDFMTGMPGPTNPWPDLFTFVGGSFSISRMTLTDPYSTPTQGYYFGGYPPYPGLGTALYAGILVTSLTQVSATIDHVTVLGTSGDALGLTNMWDGVLYGGELMPTPQTTTIPISGTFSVTNSVFDSEVSGPQIGYSVGATVTDCYNTITNAPYPTGFIDSYNSKIVICGNQISNVMYGAGISASQGEFTPGTLPSTVYITNNRVSQVSQGANGAFLYDNNVPPTLNAVITGNTFQNTSPEGVDWGYSVIASLTLKSTIISLNNIAGGGSDGIYLNGGPGTIIGNIITGAANGVLLDVASGVHVAGNVVRDTGVNGIVVMSFNYAGSSATTPSSNDFVIGNFVHNSGSYDLYWDGLGASNHWCGNVYQTSNFLPSC